MWLGFSHRTGRYQPGGCPFSSPGCWSCRESSDPGMKPYPPRVRRDLDVVPRGNSRRALSPCAPANQQPASGVRDSTPCRAVSTREISVFVPGLLELYIYGRISDAEIGTYPPRVRRDLDVGPRVYSRRALATGNMSPSQSAISQWGGFPHRAGRYRPGRYLFSSPACWSCRIMEGFLIRG